MLNDHVSVLYVQQVCECGFSANFFLYFYIFCSFFDQIKKFLMNADMSNSDMESDVEELPYLDPEIYGYPDYDEPQYHSNSNNEDFSYVDKHEGTSTFTESLIAKNLTECSEADKILKSAYENERTNEAGACSSSPTLPHPKEIDLPIPCMEEPYIVRPGPPPFDFSMSDCLKQRKIKPTNKTIGFLGFTKVAQGIIKNLCHSGHSVIICKQEPDHDFNGHRNLEECKIFAKKLSIKITDTPADVFKAADIIFNHISNYERYQYFKFIENTLFEEIKNSRSKKGYVEMTALLPRISAHIASKVQSYGGRYLEAPFCGSRVDAAKGTLHITTAGNKELYDDCKSCFDAISEHHDYMSPENGNALRMNTIYNMFTGTTYAMLAEAMALLEERHLGKVFIEVLKMSGLNSSGLVHKAQSMLDKNFDTETSVHEMHQNFILGLQLGHELDHSTAIFAAVNELYERANNRKYGTHDVSAVIQAIKPKY